MILHPTPKINLGLDILRRREDGFHDIDTLMIPFGGVCDTIEILPTASAGVKLEVEGLTIDCASDRNLVVRAWMLVRERCGIDSKTVRRLKANDNIETKTLGFCETDFESTAEQSVEADISLPDYCPEIKRILKCTVTADILSVQCSEGKITAQGNAVVRVIYIGDNDKISAYEQICPVSKSAESEKVHMSNQASVKAVTDYVNCRAVSSRRIDIRAMMTFVFRSTRKREETVLSCAEGKGIQVLSGDYSFADLKTVTEKSFYLTEVIELSSDKPIIGRIINSSAYISINDKKIINNKMLIKGDCYIKIYYILYKKKPPNWKLILLFLNCLFFVV